MYVYSLQYITKQKWLFVSIHKLFFWNKPALKNSEQKDCKIMIFNSLWFNMTINEYYQYDQWRHNISKQRFGFVTWCCFSTSPSSGHNLMFSSSIHPRFSSFSLIPYTFSLSLSLPKALVHGSMSWLSFLRLHDCYAGMAEIYDGWNCKHLSTHPFAPQFRFLSISLLNPLSVSPLSGFHQVRVLAPKEP